jgi:hypothetical protein
MIVLYHGTSKENATSILKRGFKFGDCSDYGKAIYFSESIEVAKDYALKNGVIITCLFTGNILDMGNSSHFELYKQMNNAFLNSEVKTKGYHALKDGYIIAVYSKKHLDKIRLTDED